MKPHVLFLASISMVGVVNSEELDWKPLLDESMSQFQTYIGVPDSSVFVPNYDPNNTPLGLDHDPIQVFKVVKKKGELVLQISGKIEGLATTRKVYGNYHLKAQFRWGYAKYGSFLDQPRDSGILYHGFGPTKIWPSALEYQIKDGAMGECFTSQDTSWNNTTNVPENAEFASLGSAELPSGQWNSLEFIVFKDNSIHLLNGKIVKIYTNLKIRSTNAPLEKGLIHFQSRGAECEFKNIEIRAISKIPAAYQAFIDSKP